MAGTFFSWDKKVILVKKETTAGTDSVPTGALNAIRASNLSISLEGDEVTNSNDLSYFSNDDIDWSNKTFKINGEILMYGSGTAGTAPAYSPLIIGCGYAETVTASTSVLYTPVSGSSETVSIYLYLGSILFKATYAKGTAKYDAGIGEFTKFGFEFVGVYLEPVDSAPSGVVYTTGTPLIGSTSNSELSVHGTKIDGQTISIDSGNVNNVFETTETYAITNDDRKVSASITANANPLSQFNPYSISTAKTQAEVYWTAGTTAGNIIKFSMPKAQLGLPQAQDVKNKVGYDIPIIPFSNTGDDEHSILFT